MTKPTSSLELIPISPGNYEAALSLSVRPDQEDLVASVQKSLADAYVYEDALFRLAFLDDTVIGYLLLFPFDSDRGRMVNVVRLMIDQRFQAQGLGRRLLDTALDWIQTFEPTVEVVRISTLPRNQTALALYERAGFIRSGLEDGEIALYLELGR
jgi:diamine N-acetyltransferase